ncbi:MAG: hypothetical protein AAF211_19010, partial [Myxococcota bacterium]
DPTRIWVRSIWTWERPIPRDSVVCTLDCRRTGAELDLGTFDDGVYEVQFGDEVVTLTIPGTDRICLGGFPYGRDAEGREVWW